MLRKLEKNWLLIIILEFAFFLRAYGMSFGLPYIYEADAHVYINRAVCFLQTGDWNPHWFGNPASILMYLLAALYALYFIIAKSFGFFNDMQSFTNYLRVNPTYFYLIGRVLMVFFGTLSTLITYKIGKKIFGKKVGLIAAFLFAVIPMHVGASKIIRTDIMATFFILLSFLYCIHILEEDNLHSYIMAGIFAGLATATKYSAALVILMIIIARIMRKGRTLFRDTMDHGVSAPLLEGWMFTYIVAAIFAGLATATKYSAALVILMIIIARIMRKGRTLFRDTMDHGVSAPLLEGWALFILGMWLTIFGMRFSYAFIPKIIPSYFPLDLTQRFLSLFKITPRVVIISGISLVIISLLQGRFVQAFRTFLRNSLLNSKVILALVVSMCCFFMATPFFLLDLSTAYDNIHWEVTEVLLGTERLSFFQNYGWYLENYLLHPEGVGILVNLAAICGAIYIIWKKNRKAYILLVFLLIYFLSIAGIFGRRLHWTMPIFSFSSILAGVFIVKTAGYVLNRKRLGRHTNLILAISVLLIVSPSTVRAIHQDYLLTQKDTRTYAKEWVEKSLPQGSKIGQEGCIGLHLDRNLFQVTEKFTLSDKDLRYYVEIGFDFLLVSDDRYGRYFSDSKRYPYNVGFYRTLFKQGKLLKEFRPSLTRPGPTIKIIDIKGFRQSPAAGRGKWQVDPSNLVIMTGSSATLPESTAATDLKNYIASKSGVTPSIVTDTYTGSKQIISIGMPTTSSEISSFQRSKSLPKYDGYTIDIPSSGRIHVCSKTYGRGVVYGVYHLMHLMKFSKNKIVLEAASLYEEPDFKIRKVHINEGLNTSMFMEETFKIMVRYPYRFNAIQEWKIYRDIMPSLSDKEYLRRYGLEFNDGDLYYEPPNDTVEGWTASIRDQLDPDRTNNYITGLCASSWEIYDAYQYPPFLQKTYDVVKGEYGKEVVLRCLVDYRFHPHTIENQWNKWKTVLNDLPFSDFQVRAYSDYGSEQAPWNPGNPRLNPILNDSVKGEKIAEFKLYDEQIHGGRGEGVELWPQMVDPIPQNRANYFKDRFVRHKNNSVKGVTIWLGKGCDSVDAFCVNDEINLSSLYAFGSLAWDTNQDVENEILYAWAKDKYGPKAAPHIAHYLVNTHEAFLYQVYKMDYTGTDNTQAIFGTWPHHMTTNPELDPRAKRAMDEMYYSLYAARPYLSASVYNEYLIRTDKLCKFLTDNSGGYTPPPQSNIK